MHDDDATKSTAENARGAPAGETPERSRRGIRLTDEQRRYVVRRLAAHDGPTKIARDMRRRFGVEITRQAIAHYDPTREPQTGQRWAHEFVTARSSLLAAHSDKSAKVARIERLVLRAIEMIADRIFKGVDAEGRKMFAKRPEDITDNDRIRALVAFVRWLKASNPAGYAEIRDALMEQDEARAAPIAPAAPDADRSRGEEPDAA